MFSFNKAGANGRPTDTVSDSQGTKHDYWVKSIVNITQDFPILNHDNLYKENSVAIIVVSLIFVNIRLGLMEKKCFTLN